MKLDEVNKLIDALYFKKFLENFGFLITVEIGGIAEPLLHPQLINVLQLFKKYYPTQNVILYTNGLLLDERISSRIIEERLVTGLVVSVDALTDKDHYAVKGIAYSTVETNLKKFIFLRDRYKSNCKLIINVLTYKRYCNLVKKFLKRRPLNIDAIDNTFMDNTKDIIKKWKKICSINDIIRDAAPYFQLRGEYRKEGDLFSVDEKKLKCPWVQYVVHSINITSNGDWIYCCNDFYKENILGNFLKDNLYEIAVSTKRDRFIKALMENNSGKLPSRCKQKKYCQFFADDWHERAESIRLKRGGRI